MKASSHAAAEDFAGPRFLRDRLGQRFRAGLVLHPGRTTLPCGDRLAAAPIDMLWSLGRGKARRARR